MNLSSLNTALNDLSNKITKYLDNTPRIEFATYEQTLDTKYITNQYSKIVNVYSGILDLIREEEYFISQCRKGLRLLSENTNLEREQRSKLKTTIDLVTEISTPLYTEEKRLKTIEMYYRNLYSRKDF